MCQAVSAGDFEVRRLIGRGCYSMVYEVVKKTGTDSGSLYALKRFFLENDSSVKCVLRERHILERLALAEYQSPFLPMLLYGIWFNYSSAFVLREGAGSDLYDLLCHVGYLSESNARFYVAEIVCGLEHLHSLDIVHLDIKPENILFYSDGHVFVSDLDRSYDRTIGKKPTLDDFTGTPLFMAPEIAKGEIIDIRADIWSLGVLVAEMVAGPIRSDSQTTAQEFQRARMGSYSIRGLKKFSKPLQSFFTACLQKNYNQRPFLKDVKKLRFLKCVDWDKMYKRLLPPPYKISEIRHRPAKDDRGPLKSTDGRVLASAFSPAKPVIFVSHRTKAKVAAPVSEPAEVHEQPGISTVLTDELRGAGYTLDSLNYSFRSFNFVHPQFRNSDVSKEDPIALHKSADITSILLDDLKLVEPTMPSSPSLFRRTRSRGISIGD
ncbi:hypothetical protein AHF37_12311 [Paragonimus kellicotti]|nr:hypothetical protein AHF37_12311 [Paragonimus kellicotti]